MKFKNAPYRALVEWLLIAFPARRTCLNRDEFDAVIMGQFARLNKMCPHCPDVIRPDFGLTVMCDHTCVHDIEPESI